MTTQTDTDGQRPLKTANDGLRRTVADTVATQADVEPASEYHTLTVLDVLQLFEAAGVKRSLRSIERWCKPNAQNEKRLDAFLDPETRKYYVTRESVERVIAEEKAKDIARRISPMPLGVIETLEEPHDRVEAEPNEVTTLQEKVKQLEIEKFDLTASNKAKEMLIERLDKQINTFASRLEHLAKTVGLQEARINQLAGPKPDAHHKPFIDDQDHEVKDNPESPLVA